MNPPIGASVVLSDYIISFAGYIRTKASYCINTEELIMGETKEMWQCTGSSLRIPVQAKKGDKKGDKKGNTFENLPAITLLLVNLS